MTTKNPQLPPEAIAALERGQTIDAIKCVRESTNLGLKESKDLVDQHLKQHPDLKMRHTTARAADNRKGALWTVVLVVLAALAYSVVTGRLRL